MFNFDLIIKENILANFFSVCILAVTFSQAASSGIVAPEARRCNDVTKVVNSIEIVKTIASEISHRCVQLKVVNMIV